MKYIRRTIEDDIRSRLECGKAIVIYGARQTGKTTLARQILSPLSDVVFLTGDDTSDASLFSEVTMARWEIILGRSKTIFVDEAQRIANIGQAVKLLVDSRPDIQLIMTGSSSFSLAAGSEEALTGRKKVFTLFPLSFQELAADTSVYEEMKQLEKRLIYGSYPEIVTDEENSEENLALLSESYLFRDLLQYGGIRKPEVLGKLLRALALQIGSTVSLNGLSSLVGYSRTLIGSYLKLLEEAFIIFRLEAFSTNARNEIRKSCKYYFYDNGIRNSIIQGYSLIQNRGDVGSLWENYLISERLKYNSNNRRGTKMFFWRTLDGMEVDYVEMTDGKMAAFEFKWNPDKKSRVTRAFTNRYPDCPVKTITRANYQEFLS